MRYELINRNNQKHLACSEETSGLFLTLVVSFCWQIIEARDSEIDGSRLQRVLIGVFSNQTTCERNYLPCLAPKHTLVSLPWWSVKTALAPSTCSCLSFLLPPSYWSCLSTAFSSTLLRLRRGNDVLGWYWYSWAPGVLGCRC